ncbi:MAG: hypothetical protein LKI03_06115 [Acetobacter indonesiensis]|nr:hypothetical protein [Acetobacter indonesiensis]MCI1546161.1 hypothetical protein [Acetobacter indonesiensis]MCI1765606.1 hypothetical protein [Acetobacter indonesiensis]
MPLQRGHVVQFARYRAVCLVNLKGKALVCKIIQPDDLWHRADMPLDWLDCMMNGLTTELRIRCWPHIVRNHDLQIVGEVSASCMDRVDRMVDRERGLRGFEEKWSLGDGRTEKARP